MDLEHGKRGNPFQTEAGTVAYRDLFERGPLVEVFKDERLRLAPAKGARKWREKDPLIFEQTYFAHALNVSITAGILFETASASAPGGAATEREMRIVLGAGTLHDFNKLEPLVGELGLSRAIREFEPEARRLLQGYVEEKDVEDVLHLAISVEAGTGADASRYATTMPARRGTLATWCLQLADQLAGTHADPNDAERYRSAVARFAAQWPAVPEIRVQALALLPQAALSRAARQALLDWIRDHGRLVHESERYVSWIGPEPTEGDYDSMDSGLWDRIQPSPEAAFDKAGASHNALRTTWIDAVAPTPENVDRWIEHFGGQLVVWEGDWGIRNFSHLANAFPDVFRFDKKPRPRVRVEVPRDDGEAPAHHHAARRLAKLVVAHCVRQKLRDVRTMPPGDPAPFESADLEGVMASTVPGILWARAEREVPGAYEKTVQEITQLLATERQESANPVSGVLRALLGRGEPPEPGATGSGCIYCGTACEREVEDALVFGIKPTAWAPRKKGIQKESHRGVVCDRCIVENRLRDAAARASNAVRSDAGYLTAHVHAADLVCDVNWEALKPLLSADIVDGGAGALVMFPKSKPDAGGETKRGQVVPLRGHASIPIPKPKGSGSVSDTLVQLWRLRDCLAFVRQTSFKVHVSPLALAPTQERAQLRWTNPPAWMETLGLANVHVDELLERTGPNGERRPSVPDVVNALIRAGNATGGQQGHRAFVSRLARDRLAVYDVADPKQIPTDPSHFTRILEDYFVPDDEKASLTAAAFAFIRFNARGEWSNNTWTWATRELLELRERYGREPDARSLIVGDLVASATRKWDGAPVEFVEQFVDAMADYLARFRGGHEPIGPDRRVLINAIAYQCRKNYRTVFPKEVAQ